MKKIAVFVSGGGSNFIAIHRQIIQGNILGKIVMVFSNNPNCGAINTQEDHKMAESIATSQSWPADNLTYAPDPPHHFGMVTFEEGGRMMADFTVVDDGGVAVGDEFRLVFRIKAADERRNFNKYFWKAAPKVQTV